MRFSKWLCAVGIAFICVVYGAGTALAQDNKVLRIPYLEDPKTADCQTQTISYLLPLNCFDRLVECITVGPGESKIVPGLAERWEISDDGRVYTFYLRKGVFFHHGTELTADDVVYTFDRMLDPNTRALNTDILDWVEGARERMDGKAIYTKGLEALDRYTVQITLRGPYAPFLAVMASPQASIYNREFTIKSGNRFGLTPETTSGTGPFVMKEYVLNDHLLLVANEDYYRGRPQVDEILVRITPDPETLRMLFEAGEIDIFDCDYAVSQIPYFTNHPKWKDYVASSPRVGIYYYSINQRIKPFDDVRVRKALQMAIDRKLILDELFYGKGHLENGIMPRGLICHNPDLPAIEYDPEKAKALLAQAGYPDGVEMEIAQVSGARQWLRINEVVQAMLREAG
ncbi:MAG TPA: ABC transporter substrate-binding protein, partial [Thermosynergistes sp.]|nr:ABC transporter substrate-binding protein [Thermosynergistes sp.]